MKAFSLHTQHWYGLGLVVATVFSTGRLSLATDIASPAKVISGDSPTVELSQNTTAGNPANLWYYYGNEQAFEIAHANTTSVPFHLTPSAASHNAIYVDALGNVGQGTDTPRNIGAATGSGRFLNLKAPAGGACNFVAQGEAGAQMHLVHLNAPANQRIVRFQCSSGTASFHVLNDSLTSYAIQSALTIKMSNGNIGLRVLNPTHPLQLASGAYCSSGGVWTNSSSRALKEAIKPLSSEEALKAVQELQPVGYRYKADPQESHVGFIAEDVPDIVATRDRKGIGSMDVVAVLTKVVQDQQQELQKQRALLEEQRNVLAQQQQMLDKLLQDRSSSK